MADEISLHFGPYRLDAANARLWRETQPVRLTPKAFQVLCYVVERPGQLVSKEELFTAVWADTVISDATLTSAIQEIRKALQDNPREPQYLETVPKRGFRFIGQIVRRREEENHKPVLSLIEEANGENGLASSVQSRESTGQGSDSVMPALRPSSGQAAAGIQESRVPAVSESPWIPASAGMTPPPSTPPLLPLPQAEQTRDPRLNDARLLQQSWSVRSLVLMGLVLIVGTVLIVQYLSRLAPSSQDSALRIQEAQLPLPDKPSLIVLPLVNLSNDPEQEYFSDGLTEVLTGDLSKISSLFIIAHNSALTYKNKAAKVQDISREMGVRYVLEGSVQKATQRVRVNVQLIDATTGYHVWSQQYDRPLTDIFAVQDEIVQQIVTTLKLQLTLEEQGVLVRKHTDHLDAYDAYLRGEAAFYRFTKEDNAQARQLYEQALALDPHYVEMYAMIAQTYLVEWNWRWSTDPQTLAHAFALAQQALALDDSSPAAHALLSYAHALKQEHEQALMEGERAIALDPNNASGYALQAEALMFAGRPEDASRAVAQAMRLNPSSPPYFLILSGWVDLMTGRYTEAIAMLTGGIRRSPNWMTAYPMLAWGYVGQWVSQENPAGQTLEPALAAAQRALALNDSYYLAHIILGDLYLLQQHYDQALVEMERAVALAPSLAESYASLAVVRSCMGRTDEALEASAQALHLQPSIVDGHLADVGIAYAMVGHYEEAREALQRYLHRYPNILPAHLALAGVYSELGQEAEARAEAAEVLQLNPNFSVEVHRQRMPIKDPAKVERTIAALRKAGLK